MLDVLCGCQQRFKTIQSPTQHWQPAFRLRSASPSLLPSLTTQSAANAAAPAVRRSQHLKRVHGPRSALGCGRSSARNVSGDSVRAQPWRAERAVRQLFWSSRPSRAGNHGRATTGLVSGLCNCHGSCTSRGCCRVVLTGGHCTVASQSAHSGVQSRQNHRFGLLATFWRAAITFN